jgi:hypothetical protein
VSTHGPGQGERPSRLIRCWRSRGLAAGAVPCQGGRHRCDAAPSALFFPVASLGGCLRVTPNCLRTSKTCACACLLRLPAQVRDARWRDVREPALPGRRRSASFSGGGAGAVHLLRGHGLYPGVHQPRLSTSRGAASAAQASVGTLVRHSSCALDELSVLPSICAQGLRAGRFVAAHHCKKL